MIRNHENMSVPREGADCETHYKWNLFIHLIPYKSSLTLEKVGTICLEKEFENSGPPSEYAHTTKI